MKRTAVLVAAVALLSWTGCSGGGDGNSKRIGVLYGQLVDSSTGRAVSGLGEMEAGGKTIQTNENGFFSIELAADKSQLLRIEVKGYAATSRHIQIPSATSSFIRIAMLPFTGTSNFEVAEGGVVTSYGASVSFPPNSLAAAGEVTAYLARLDAEDPDQLSAFPGDFRTDQGELLESFGALAVEVRNADGERVNMQGGSSASIEIPASSNAPASVPLWYFDETTGVWVEQGSLDGCEEGVCTGTIDSLAWWNADRVQETTCLVICANNTNDEPATGLSLQAAGVDYNGISSAFSQSDGCVCLQVRVASTVEVTGVTSFGIVGPASFSTAAEQMACGDPRCPRLDPPLVAETPKFQAILTWGEEPSDLDSHLTGPVPVEIGEDPERFEVYYSNKGSLVSEPFAYLDTDDTSSFGPEITTISRCFQGVYRYSIYNYSGSGSLQTSGASVLLLLPDGSLETVAVPSGDPTEDRIWIVGDLSCNAACDCTWRLVNRLGPNDFSLFHPE